MQSYIYSFDSDIGLVRKKNEDFVYATVNRFGDILLCIFDGMGGHNKGELAARTSMNSLINCFKDLDRPFVNVASIRKWLSNSIKNINKQVYNLSLLPTNKDMGTTLVAVVISSSKVVYTSVGDSRLYITSNNTIKQITKDDSYCFYLYEKGKITKDEINSHPRRNEITKAIGVNPSIKIKTHILKEEFSRILLCTDGLYNKVDEEKIKEILYRKIDIKFKVNELIDTANKNGGEDNIGVLICEVVR